MKDYVEFFLKLKIENNKHYIEEECNKMNESHVNLLRGILLNMAAST